MDAFQRGASAEGYVSLSTDKYAAGEVDNDPAEGQSLAFVDGDGPCQPYGELREGAEYFLFYLLFLLVVFVAAVIPLLRLHVALYPVVGDDLEGFVFFVEAADYAYGAVHPAMVEVILNEDDLCSRFQYQLP